MWFELVMTGFNRIVISSKTGESSTGNHKMYLERVTTGFYLSVPRSRTGESSTGNPKMYFQRFADWRRAHVRRRRRWAWRRLLGEGREILSPHRQKSVNTTTSRTLWGYREHQGYKHRHDQPNAKDKTQYLLGVVSIGVDSFRCR